MTLASKTLFFGPLKCVLAGVTNSFLGLTRNNFILTCFVSKKMSSVLVHCTILLVFRLYFDDVCVTPVASAAGRL